MSDATKRREKQKDAILDAVLTHAAFDGWSKRALLAAADELEVDHATAQRLFPRNGESLIEWLDHWLDRQMIESVDIAGLQALPVRTRIRDLVRARFEALGPHKESMRRAALTRGLPHNVLRSGRGIWRTADKIWQLAGFANLQTDGFSRYTRRALLAGILTSTFFFWLEDMSDDLKDTFAFLDRRIDNALSIGKVSGQLKSLSPRQWFQRAAG